MNLNQVTVQSVNIAESIAFYQRLGLRLIVEDAHYARFELPVGDATFSVHLTDSPLRSNTVVYFEVDDLLATAQRLKANGVVFSAEPEKQSWLWHEARLHDPSGNEICLYHAGENRRFPPWRVPL